MKHQMRLISEAFNNIKNGSKKIEIRLFDEKRQQVKIGDIIEFSKLPNIKEEIAVEVIGIKKYSNYEHLVEDTSLKDFGGDLKSKEDIMKKGCVFYTKEEQEKYGFVVFRIKLLSD